MKHTCPHNGFTLVELSIVLVILGLLVGGILSGQSLVRAAQLRAVNTEYQKHVTAIHAFRDKYFALPGDIANATKFWGVADATAATCVTTASADKRTCDGNGDAIISPSAGSNEYYRSWQHLANAGLMEGSYDGVTHGTTANSSTRLNSPQSRLSNGLWFIWNWNTTLAGSATAFDGPYLDNMLLIGGAIANASPVAPLFKPEETWNMDTKMDDGLPAQGIVVIRQWADCTTKPDGTAATSDSLNAIYKLNETGIKCTPYFRRAA